MMGSFYRFTPSFYSGACDSPCCRSDSQRHSSVVATFFLFSSSALFTCAFFATFTAISRPSLWVHPLCSSRVRQQAPTCSHPTLFHSHQPYLSLPPISSVLALQRGPSTPPQIPLVLPHSPWASLPPMARFCLPPQTHRSHN